HALACHFNITALAVLGAHIQRAGVGNDAAVSQQADAAAVAGFQAARLDDAFVVDGHAGDFTGGLHRRQHGTAIGADHAGVADIAVYHGFVNFNPDRTTQVQAYLAARAHHHLAATYLHGADVLDLCRDHGDETTVSCPDLSLVDDTFVRIAFEAVIACHEVLIAEVHGGGQQRRDFDLGRGAEQDAVRVQQEYTAIGVDRAVDDGWIATHHTVQCHRIGGRLVELHGVASTDIKALPVYRQLVAGLVDDHGAAVLRDVAITGADGAAGGQGGHRTGMAQQQNAAGADAGQSFACGALRFGLAFAPGDFGGYLPYAQCCIPYHAVDAIECAVSVHVFLPLLRRVLENS